MVTVVMRQADKTAHNSYATEATTIGTAVKAIVEMDTTEGGAIKNPKPVEKAFLEEELSFNEDLDVKKPPDKAATIHDLNLKGVEYEELEKSERFEEANNEEERRVDACYGEPEADHSLDKNCGGQPKPAGQSAGGASKIIFSSDGFSSGGEKPEIAMAQQKMLSQSNKLEGKMIELLALLAPPDMFSYDDEMEAMNAELKADYANLAGEVNKWKREHDYIMDHAVHEDFKQAQTWLMQELNCRLLSDNNCSQFQRTAANTVIRNWAGLPS